MRHRARLAAIVAAAVLLPVTADAAATPAALATAIEKALETGDPDALVAQVALDQPSAMALFVLLDMPGDCAGDVVCRATAGPLDEEWRAEQVAGMAERGEEMAVAPEGMITVEGRSEGEDGSSSLRVRMPYAKVGGEYRVVMGRLTAAKLAELRATTPQMAADGTLAGGIYDPATGERDMEWKIKATPLPADGGEPGAAFLAGVAQVATAVKANDVDAAAAARGEWGRIVLGATDYEGKPVPLADRQRKLRSQAVRFVVAARVLGGWQHGDTAVLVVEGTNGAGNTVRGAQIMQRQEGVWTDAGADLLEIPAER